MNWIAYFTWGAASSGVTEIKLQKGLALTTVLAGLILLSGCWTYSVHPLAEKDDPHVAYDPLLEGVWEPRDNHCGKIVIAGDSKAQEYTVTLIELENDSQCDGTESGVQFSARLVQLGTGRFLDAVASGHTAEIGAQQRAHSIIKVLLNTDSLDLVPLSDSWFCDASKAEQANLGECVNGDFMMTMHTDVLQEFVKNHADDVGVFPEPNVDDTLHRERKSGDSK
jgi:hypothetical protein